MTAYKVRFDAFLPPEMAQRAEHVGIAKTELAVGETIALGILAGAFIAMGAIFATTVTAGGASLPFGGKKLLAGLVFSLGLILVIVAGAELFTGNNLIIMAWADRRISTFRLLRNWALVYTGNFIGSVATVIGIYLAAQYKFGQGTIGVNALAIADAKIHYSFLQAVMLGVFCNALVCLAVWLCLSARSTADKVLSIIFPITAFVAAGFEHSVANMFFIPMGLFIKMDHAFMVQVGATYADLTWGNFLWRNLLPVTIGNIIGGAVFVGLVYWYIYLRPKAEVL